MTEPLITQEDIEDILYDVLVHLDPKTTLHLPLAAVVYDMLRRELTPEVLSPFEEPADGGSLGSKDGKEEYDVGWLTNGANLHRRIFGETE